MLISLKKNSNSNTLIGVLLYLRQVNCQNLTLLLTPASSIDPTNPTTNTSTDLTTGSSTKAPSALTTKTSTDKLTATDMTTSSSTKAPAKIITTTTKGSSTTRSNGSQCLSLPGIMQYIFYILAFIILL